MYNLEEKANKFEKEYLDALETLYGPQSKAKELYFLDKIFLLKGLEADHFFKVFLIELADLPDLWLTLWDFLDIDCLDKLWEAKYGSMQRLEFLSKSINIEEQTVTSNILSTKRTMSETISMSLEFFESNSTEKFVPSAHLWVYKDKPHGESAWNKLCRYRRAEFPSDSRWNPKNENYAYPYAGIVQYPTVGSYNFSMHPPPHSGYCVMAMTAPVTGRYCMKNLEVQRIPNDRGQPYSNGTVDFEITGHKGPSFIGTAYASKTTTIPSIYFGQIQAGQKIHFHLNYGKEKSYGHDFTYIDFVLVCYPSQTT